MTPTPTAPVTYPISPSTVYVLHLPIVGLGTQVSSLTPGYSVSYGVVSTSA